MALEVSYKSGYVQYALRFFERIMLSTFGDS